MTELHPSYKLEATIHTVYFINIFNFYSARNSFIPFFSTRIRKKTLKKEAFPKLALYDYIVGFSSLQYIINYSNMIISSPYFYALTSQIKQDVNVTDIQTVPACILRHVLTQMYKLYVKQQLNHIISSFKNVNLLFKYKSK